MSNQEPTSGPRPESAGPWQTHASHVVHENDWMHVREDEVTRPDGTPGSYGVLRVRRPAVFVVALTAADEVVLVRLFRYPIGRWSWEVPAGGAESALDTSLDTASAQDAGIDLVGDAQRELREEAGLVAASWTDLGRVYSLNGLADAPGRVFLARELSSVPGSAADQREEGIDAVRRVPWADLPALARGGELSDNETLAALQLARWHLDSAT